MAELNVASNKALGTAIKLYEGLNDVFKAFGIVAGGVAASLADWVFGAVTMTVLLSNYAGLSSGATKWFMGGIFSLALWGVQIILWQIVLSGKIARFSRDKTTSASLYIAVFIGIILMKFGDDFSDIAGVWWLIKDNPMQASLNAAMYKGLLVTIFFLVWAICGFAEIFVALSINMLKSGNEKSDRGGGQNQNNQNRPNNNHQNNQNRHDGQRHDGQRHDGQHFNDRQRQIDAARENLRRENEQARREGSLEFGEYHRVSGDNGR